MRKSYAHVTRYLRSRMKSAARDGMMKSSSSIKLSIFSSAPGISAFVAANVFLSPRKERKEDTEDLSDARRQIEEYKKLLEEQDKTDAVLKAKFETLENMYEPSSKAG